MKQLIRFFLLAMVILFPTNSAFSADFIKELAGKQFMLSDGEISKTTKSHALVEFKGGEKGKYIFVFQKKGPLLSYSIEGESISFSEDNNLLVVYTLDKQRVGDGDIIYLKEEFTERVIYSLIPPPRGYEDAIKATCLHHEGESQEKVIKLLKKALKDASSELPYNYSDVAVYKISGYLMGLGCFKDARSGFLAINEEKKAAEAVIQMIANGEDVDVDIKKTASLAWEALAGFDSSENVAGYYAAAEAIPYVCAKKGEYALAKKYAVAVLQAAQRDWVSANEKIREAGIDTNRMENLAVTYGDGHSPDVFRASTKE